MSKKLDFSNLELITTKKELSDSLEISLSEIEPNPNQPRILGKKDVEDLLPSMKELGLIEPIIVKKIKQGFQIVAGERRFQAAKILKWETIKAIQTDAELDKCYEMSLIENEKRKNLNPWEVGKAISHLRAEYKKTAKEVSELLGYTERYIKQLSAIARLDQKTVLQYLKTGGEPSVKNLESLLKQKEGRGGEIVSRSKDRNQKNDIIEIDISTLPANQKIKFLKDLDSLKLKYHLK